jgi:hypothetical protein
MPDSRSLNAKVGSLKVAGSNRFPLKGRSPGIFVDRKTQSGKKGRSP